MMISLTPRLFLPVFFFLGAAAFLRADVKLPAIFSDHAVLEKSDKVPVWGTAVPSEPVIVTLDKATASTTTGADGKWKVQLDLHAEGQGPYDLVVQGNNKLTVADVVVGEVWMCGGQSNMWLRLADTANAPEEAAQSANPMLREFAVSLAASITPKDDVRGKWIIADPSTTLGFTAVGYYFGKKIQKELNCPVGLLDSSYGGTPVEAWTSPQGFQTLAADDPLRVAAEKAPLDFKASQDYTTQYQAWMTQNNRADHPATDHLDDFVKLESPTADWKTVTLPSLFATAGLPDAGAVWVRRKVTIPDNLANTKLSMHVGDFHDSVTVYWNGQKVGQGQAGAAPPLFYIDPKLVQAGDNTVALRVFCPATGGGIAPGKFDFTVNGIKLDGDWLAKAEFDLPALDDAAKASLPVPPPAPRRPQDVASSLFNAMIYPMLPYAITGAIWFQGESNAGRAFQYRTAFPLLIKDWRAQWGQGDFPFYFCQLSNFSYPPSKPGDSGTAELREAQSMTLSVPNTGEAILIDIGEAANIHSRDKVDVGNRLAYNALAKTYGKPVIYSGPVYDTMTVEGSSIRVHFKGTDGGLVAKPLPATFKPDSIKPETRPLVRNSPNSEVEGFQICGDDHAWKWADAKIDGMDVLVSSTDVAKPVAVRYAWATNPICNLYNGYDLPASTFRTDDFPPMTLKAQY